MYPNTYIKPNPLSALKNINLSSILDGTQKTLGIINQGVGVIYQVQPLISNIKNTFKIASIINEPQKKEVKEKEVVNNQPVFYL